VVAAATDDDEVSGTSRATARATNAVATEAIEAFEVVRILWFISVFPCRFEVGRGRSRAVGRGGFVS